MATDGKFQILIVDDNPVNLQLAASLIAAPDHEIYMAHDGLEALAMSEIREWDLILLDIVMPELDGFEVCSRLKANPARASIPIIFLTAMHDTDCMVKGFQLGAADYVTKPFNESELVTRVHTQLELGKSRRELARKIEELEEANRELEAFSYSASHDLKSPLVTISSWITILSEQFHDVIGPDGQKALTRITQSTEHMNILIEKLMSLSRSTRNKLVPEYIDLAQIGRQIFEDLQTNSPDRKVEFVAPASLPAFADPVLLHNVLENLIGNAWKYSARQEHATIELGCIQEPTTGAAAMSTFFIRDNGAGFDPKSADKLFLPFQRLHTRNEFEGNGIGLTVVKRIILRHQGKIWAEGAVNQGACFWFTLPTTEQGD